MGNYEQLKQAVADVIKTNGNQKITGAILQNSLLTIISTFGVNATFAGIATPDTNPGTPDQNVFYLATESGQYSNFNGITLNGEIAIITNTNGQWVAKNTDIATMDRCVINCISKRNDLPVDSIGSNGDYLMYDSAYKRIYKKINGIWVKQQISLSNIYRYGNDCYIKESTADSAPFVRLDYLSQENIADNWFINTFYNLFYSNGKLPFDTREEARRYWSENLINKYGKGLQRFHGVILYYELSDGSKILEQFIGKTESARYFEDNNWVYILGNPIENVQSDFLENTESRNFIKNKILKWGKGNKLSFNDNQITPNGEWMYKTNYASASHFISSNAIKVTDDNMYLSLMPTIYSEVDTDTVQLQVYNSTKRKYIYDKTISIKTFAQSYPIALKVEKDNNYIVYIGKKACTAQYYVSNPVLYSVSVKPTLILFENDIDKDINDINENIVKINGTLSSTTEQELIYKEKNKYINITTTFGSCPVSPNDVLTIFIQTEYSDLANFRLYAEGEQQVALLYQSGNKDLSQGLQVEYIVPSDFKYSKITFRTGVVGTIALLSVNKLVAKQNGNVSTSDWKGKTYSSYGDSVTAINNRDLEAPFIIDKKSSWGVMVAKYLDFQKAIGRGIGGQGFSWGSNGGSVAFINADGTLKSRNDAYNYDNYQGNVEVPIGTTPIRGCSCSWLRIKTMYPETIKDNIDVITIMYHNDAGKKDEPLRFIEESRVDPEWAASEYYATYGGDYNINTVRGGIASTIMKMQAWMPNAILVLCTPISGRYGTAEDINVNLTDPDTQLVADIVRDMAKLMSIPLIDMYATDGINGLNRLRYISDNIHPYKLDGRKMLARAVIGGLKTIIPNIYTDVVE